MLSRIEGFNITDSRFKKVKYVFYYQEFLNKLFLKVVATASI